MTLKSMKLKCMGTLCSLAFSMICLTIKMASTVPLPGQTILAVTCKGLYLLLDSVQNYSAKNLSWYAV